MADKCKLVKMDDGEKAKSWATSEEEIFNTIVNYQRIEAKTHGGNLVYGPLTESETKRLETITEEEKPFDIPEIPSNKSDVVSSVKLLFPDGKEIETENDNCKLQPKDSAIIHFKKQQKKTVQKIKHKLEICFRLPPKQEVMILENNKRHPVKEQKDLKCKKSVDVFLFDAASCSNNSKDIHETKSVRFSEHMVTPIGEAKVATPKVQKKKKENSSYVENQIKEMHRLRVEVEQKRLELLDLKISRERESIKRDRQRSVQSLTKNTSVEGLDKHQLLNEDSEI